MNLYLKKISLAVASIALISAFSYGQGTGNHLTMSLRNCVQIKPDTIQFDLDVVSDGASTSDLRANSFQYGVNFNTGILQPGATVKASYVPLSSDFIPPLGGFSFPGS